MRQRADLKVAKPLRAATHPRPPAGPTCSFIELLQCSHGSAVPLCALQLLLPAEYAHDTIYALGEVGMLQFKDLNSDKNAFQRTYANQVGQVSDVDLGGACCEQD